MQLVSRSLLLVLRAIWNRITGARSRIGGEWEPMLEAFSLGSYLLLVDYTSRLCRQGKARVDSEVAEIFSRLGSRAEIWDYRIHRLIAAKSRLSGNFFAADRQRLREVAQQRGSHHPDNLAAGVRLDSAAR